MSNIKKLIAIIQSYEGELLETQSALELIEEIELDLGEQADKIKELEEEVGEHEEPPEFTSVFLGLDTINYYFDKGNLEITQRVETFLNRLKAYNNAGVEIF